jgi:hypothetical protein
MMSGAGQRFSTRNTRPFPRSRDGKRRWLNAGVYFLAFSLAGPVRSITARLASRDKVESSPTVPASVLSGARAVLPMAKMMGLRVTDRRRALLLTAAFFGLCISQALLTRHVLAAGSPDGVYGPSDLASMLVLCAGLVRGVRLCWWILVAISGAASTLATMTLVGILQPNLLTVGAAHIAGSESTVELVATMACGAAEVAVLLGGPLRRRQRSLRALPGPRTAASSDVYRTL